MSFWTESETNIILNSNINKETKNNNRATIEAKEPKTEEKKKKPKKKIIKKKSKKLSEKESIIKKINFDNIINTENIEINNTIIKNEENILLNKIEEKERGESWLLSSSNETDKAYKDLGNLARAVDEKIKTFSTMSDKNKCLDFYRNKADDKAFQVKNSFLCWTPAKNEGQ